MVLDSQVPVEHWGWAVRTAVDLHRRILNESLRREQRQYVTLYEMLYSYGKPTHIADKAPISYAAPLHHRRFRCWGEGGLRRSEAVFDEERKAYASTSLAKRQMRENNNKK